MKNGQIAEQLFSELEKSGYRGKIVSIEHIGDLKREIESQHSRGVLDDTFYNERLTFFKFDIPPELPDAKSIIIAIAPQPQQIVTFDYHGKTHQLTIPPTYSGRTDEKMTSIIEGVLEPNGYRIAQARLPEKLLAVHSGLAKYGRNNITYAEGLGSFYRPDAFYSDLPVVNDSWTELQMMPECEKCRACIISCPTGAIPDDRFVVHAEKCLTYFNERLTEFPDWVAPAWHNSLIGCMICQRVCPVNRQFLDWYEETVSFTEPETDQILNGVPKEQLAQLASEKLRKIYLLDEMALLPKNLRVLINQAS